MRGASERLQLPARDASRVRLGVHLPNESPSVFICLFLVRISVPPLISCPLNLRRLEVEPFFFSVFAGVRTTKAPGQCFRTSSGSAVCRGRCLLVSVLASGATS